MRAWGGCTTAAGPGPATEGPRLQAQATFGPLASGEAKAAILVRDPADAAHGYVVAAAGLGGLEVYDLSGKRLGATPSGEVVALDVGYDVSIGDGAAPLVAAVDSTSNHLQIGRASCRERGWQYV